MKRYDSLDFFRGLAVVIMVFVNLPGSWSHMYPALKHADPSGIHLADLVFPMFLWSVGYAFGIQSERLKTNISYKLFIRSILLIFLGFCLAFLSDPNIQSVRIPGVLQRIGVIYSVFAIVIYLFPVYPSLVVISMFAIFCSYTNLYWDQTNFFWSEREVAFPGSIAAHFDRFIFSENHLWKVTRKFDPEGLISTVFSILTSSLGFFHFKVKKEPKHKITFFIFIVFGCLITYFIFPIRKMDWTPSYSFFTGLILFLIFSCIEIFLEILDSKFQSLATCYFGWIFLFGRRALFCFLFIGVFARMDFFNHFRFSVSQLLGQFFPFEVVSLIFSALFLVPLAIGTFLWEKIPQISKK
ncbi:hypothetical protein P3G55_05720 [Leptospira sp. 96542]|nr:hypothetical protein [Leptospira sp. 96542]